MKGGEKPLKHSCEGKSSMIKLLKNRVEENLMKQVAVYIILSTFCERIAEVR